MAEQKPLATIAAKEEFRQALEIRGATPEDDFSEIKAWMLTPEFTDVIGAIQNLPQEEITDFLLNRNLGKSAFCFSVITPEDRMIRGFYLVGFDQRNRLAHLSGGFTRSEGRRYLVWRTIDVLLNNLFDNLGIYKVVVRIAATNRKMLFSFLGNTRFYKEAVLREEILLPNGKRSDMIIFAATANMPRAPAY